jgi:uncharacterized phiE125 gp8 family phage protein
MTMDVISIDRAGLPDGLLDLAKSQSRVQHTRDDAYFTELLGQAIDDIERAANTTLFERQVMLALEDVILPVWWVDGTCAPDGSQRLALPFNNVTALVVLAADGITDLSSEYDFTQTDLGGVGTTLLVLPATTPEAGTTFSFTAGFTDPARLAPSVRRAVLRRCAALYENREAPLAIDDPAEAGSALLWRPDL